VIRQQVDQRWVHSGEKLVGAKQVCHMTDRHPFNGLFSRTTWVSQLQKGQSNLHFNEAIYDGVAVASAGPYANHLYVVPDR